MKGTIPIEDAKSLHQLEDNSFKASIYFSEEFVEQYRRMKQYAKENGTKMGLSLIDKADRAEVMPVTAFILQGIRENLQGIVDELNQALNTPDTTEQEELQTTINERFVADAKASGASFSVPGWDGKD